MLAQDEANEGLETGLRLSHAFAFRADSSQNKATRNMQQLDNLFGFGARFSWQDSHAWVVSL